MLKKISWVALAAIAITLSVLFNYWATGQPTSFAVYTGIVAALLGAVCVVFPFRFLGITSWRTGAVILLSGLVLGCVGLFWPAPLTHVAQPKSRLDEILPEYQFSERHEIRVHATPDQVSAAIKEVTFADLSAYSALMRVRGMAAGHFSRVPNRADKVRISDKLGNPRSGFIQLENGDRETVGGMVGRPWAGGRKPGVQDLVTYRAFQDPDSVKIAYNMQVEDLGSGWSRVSSETRILALDDSARRKMARYWRLIVPGSGLIRRQWLAAIRRRAEAAAMVAQK